MIQSRSLKMISGNSSGVEHNLAKVGVASSNLVSRSIFYLPRWWNGRHKGLKIPRIFFPCRFKSGSGHHQNLAFVCTATWPSGKAEACKAFTPSSNLGVASKTFRSFYALLYYGAYDNCIFWLF